MAAALPELGVLLAEDDEVLEVPNADGSAQDAALDEDAVDEAAVPHDFRGSGWTTSLAACLSHPWKK